MENLSDAWKRLTRKKEEEKCPAKKHGWLVMMTEPLG